MANFAVERAEEGYHTFLAATPQLVAPNPVLWGMATQLCFDGMDGQDTETGLFSPVFLCTSSIQWCQGGKAFLPGRDSFCLPRDSVLESD